jgi:hypothetical protein
MVPSNDMEFLAGGGPEARSNKFPVCIRFGRNVIGRTVSDLPDGKVEDNVLTNLGQEKRTKQNWECVPREHDENQKRQRHPNFGKVRCVDAIVKVATVNDCA